MPLVKLSSCDGKITKLVVADKDNETLQTLKQKGSLKKSSLYQLC